MTSDEIREVIKQMDTPSASKGEQAWEQLRPLGADVVPYLLEAYCTFRKAQGRVALVFHCIRYARMSEDAYQLGIIALADKATLVRYRACGLLAYSQRPDAIPHLELLLDHTDKRTSEDAAAAINAIKCQNHNYFVDRTHSGQSFWHVNAGDTNFPT